MIDENNVIFKTISGSRLYGISNENSDVDIRGVCLEPIDCIIGLNYFKQFESNDGEDVVIYGLKNFIKLSLDNNPNILEILFAPVDQLTTLKTSNVWMEIKRHSEYFLSRHVADKFYGYLQGELSKMERGINNPELQPSRRDLINQYGYDTKAAGNIVRLCLEGMSLLDHGNIEFPLPDANFIKAVRSGLYESFDQFKGYLYQFYIPEFRKSELNTKLPAKPNFNKINDLVMIIYSRYLNGDL